jgi:DNA-binding XRE family transcriptional regulator
VIRELRIGRGLSPEQLGARVGLSGHTIRRVEEGKNRPTVRTKFLIALEFGMEVRDLWPA